MDNDFLEAASRTILVVLFVILFVDLLCMVFG